MTGYSTPHAAAVLHPDACTCPACVDAAIIEEDSDAIGRADWIDVRRETELQAAERAADEKAKQHDEWIDGLSPAERALIEVLCADQTIDHDDWLAGAWM